MTKFKVGDVVRCIVPPAGLDKGAGWIQNRLFVVNDVYGYPNLIYWPVGGGDGVYESALELYEPTTLEEESEPNNKEGVEMELAQIYVIVKNTERYKKGGVFERRNDYYSSEGDAFQVDPWSHGLSHAEMEVLVQKKIAVEGVKFSPKYVTLEQNEKLQAALNEKPAPKKKATKKSK